MRFLLYCFNCHGCQTNKVLLLLITSCLCVTNCDADLSLCHHFVVLICFCVTTLWCWSFLVLLEVQRSRVNKISNHFTEVTHGLMTCNEGLSLAAEVAFSWTLDKCGSYNCGFKVILCYFLRSDKSEQVEASTLSFCLLEEREDWMQQLKYERDDVQQSHGLYILTLPPGKNPQGNVALERFTVIDGYTLLVSHPTPGDPATSEPDILWL